jgi:hypothetical protein
MSSLRIKERLSTLVPSQLPEFIRSDYATFVAFLEAYYEYLEQDGYAQELIQNSRKYSDIDLTVDSFIDYFIKQYIDTIPKEILVNKKLLIKNIKDLYNTKGSKKSYDLLFRILFNKRIEIFYPSTQILKASDGKWKQKTSFFMQILSGEPEILLNNTALIKTDSSVFPIVIEDINSAFNLNGSVNDVKEFIFTNDKNYPLDVGNEIEYENFKGRVVAVPNKVTVINPGTGFKVGDILPVTGGVGFGARLKVSRINSTGGIRNAQFINYGYGYEGSFYNYFTSREGIPQTSTFEFDSPGGEITITESTKGFVDFGTVTVPEYAFDYFAQDYEGTVKRNFYTNSSTNIGSTAELGTLAVSVGNSSDAALYIELGGLARYPGYYETIDGFLSDEIFLENEDYYQTFTYVLKIDERLKDFKKVVLDLLHPAGTKLLGEFNLTNTFDLGAELTSQLRLLISRFQDQINSFDNIPTKNVIKPVDDTFTTTPEIVDKHVSKLVPSIENPNTDNIDVLLENISKTLGLNPINSFSSLEDSIPTKDVDKQIGDPGGPYAPDYFLEDYTTLTEFVIIEDELVIIFDGLINTSDELFTSESGYILNTDYATDYTGPSEDYAGQVALIS